MSVILDVSNNNQIDATALRSAHADALIAKATEGTGFVDATYEHHRSVAYSSGIPFGSYHFLHSHSPGDEALFYLRHARPKKGDLQPIVDSESAGLDGAPMSQQARRTLSCLKALAGYGYVPLWYSSLAFAEALLHYEPTLARYRLWQAQYASSRSPIGHHVTVAMWQFSQTYPLHGRRFDASVPLVPLSDLRIGTPAPKIP